MIELADMPRPKRWKGEPVSFAQRKYDGIRVLVRVYDAFMRADTRNDKSEWSQELLECPGIGPDLAKLRPGTVLDCELWIPGRPASDVKTYLINRSDQLRLTAFAAPFLAGEDLRKTGIFNALDLLQAVHGWTWIANTEQLHKGSFFGNFSEEDWKAYSRDHGWEGQVLKREHYDGWYKVKVEDTVDCVVTGFTISDSITRPGALKAIKVSVYEQGTMKEIASVGSGFDEPFRWEVDPETLIGKVCEVKYDNVQARGRLRFPRFLRWRDDKAAEDCTGDQLCVE